MISFSFEQLRTFLRALPSGLFLYPSNLAETESVAGRIRAEQISNVKRYLFSVMAANTFNALVFVVAVWQTSQREMAVAWAATVFMLTIYHGYKSQRPNEQAPTYVSARAIERAVCNACLLGSLWAVVPLLFFDGATPAGQVVIIALCAGMLGGAAFALASIPAAALAFTAPLVIASSIAIVRNGDTAYLLVGLLMLSYVAVLLRGGFVNAAQIATRVCAQAQAENRVRIDDLTGLPNRLAFGEALDRAFVRLGWLKQQFAVLYIDLNAFKEINDSLGHAAGDKLLAEVGRRLKTCVRDIDLVARLSGDEFAVLLADVNNPADSAALAESIIDAIGQPFAIDGAQICTGASVGVATAPGDGLSPRDLLKKADDALYVAKKKTSLRRKVGVTSEQHKPVLRSSDRKLHANRLARNAPKSRPRLSTTS